MSQSTYLKRRLVSIHPEYVANVSNTDYPGHYPNEDNSWNLSKFKQNFHVRVRRLSQRSIELDLVGIDTSVANAFRRILLSEVPTIAIEYVYAWDNTSVIADEILAHRLGLIPLNIDPSELDFKKGPQDQATDRNTIVFRLQIACHRKPKSAVSSGVAKGKKLGIESEYENSVVTARDLEWVPQGEQAEVFADKPPRPTNEDIVITKLRPGQQIDMELHAIKGVAKEHAKWSAVATASYRLLPLIVLNPEKPVPPESAEKFQACFSPGVIKIDPTTKTVSVDEESMRNEAMSREVFRHKEFNECVELKRVRDFFIFNIESEGPYSPESLLPEAIKLMRTKISTIRAAAEELLAEYKGESSTEDVHMADE